MYPIVRLMKQTDTNSVLVSEESSVSEAKIHGSDNILKHLPSAIYICDSKGRITFYNDIAAELWGYRPALNDDEKLFCAFNKVWTLDGKYIAPTDTPMAVALKTGQSFRNVEALVERPDGSTFYAVVNIDPLFDEAKKITGAINIFQDISKMKHAEFLARQNEKNYKQLIEGLNAAVYTTDADGKIVLYNKKAAELWGREPEIGKEFWCGSYKINNPDGSHLPLENCPMAVALREGRPVFGEEIVVVRPDGSLRNVAPYPQPIFDEAGKVMGAVNMLVDISGIKNSENIIRESEKKFRELSESLEKEIEERTKDLVRKNEELKRSEERYHKMVEEVEDYAIILLDENGIIQNWNKGAERIKGYKDTDIVGKSFENFYLDADRRRGLPKRLIGEARREGKAIHEGWRRRKDGSTFWGSIVLTALHDKENNVIGFSKVTRDLTERKLAEDKLREYTNQLEFQNKELEQFAYAASHDMKEPLRKIHFYNSFINENAHLLDNKSKEYLQRSINSVKRMSDLIEDLLMYSKTTSNIDAFEPVDLNEIVEELKLVHKEEIEQKKVSITSDKLPTIDGIEFQIKQLFSNLFSNSIKYKHPERNVKIKIDYQLVNYQDIRDRGDDHFETYHKVSVSDNGIGFDPQYAEKVFEIFQRLNNLPGTKGSGIGLAICKKIVQNHKGFIQATGKSNAGAKFSIFLPVTD